MRTILKKNQVIISVIAVMLIAAGYMNYTANTNQALETAALADTEKYASLGDATLVNANIITEENTQKNLSEQENIIEDSTNNINEKQNTEVQTSNNIIKDQYFTNSRLERETMYSQMLENYQKILSNAQIGETQKQIAQNEILEINKRKNAIMITENLIKNKGFEDVVIFINEESINIIIKAKDLKEEQIAQVQNIVTRELNSGIDNIHITSKE